MKFSIRFFYPSPRGVEYTFSVWYFNTTMQAEYQARKFAKENFPNCTKIMIEWESGTGKKTRTLRKDENGTFRRGRK